ncbi:hypothetical protein [Paucimonas lemoignei]|nr:hypothetical protein [Paucimonas lemoignei]
MADIQHVLEPLVEALRQPFLFNGVPIHADSRIGYVTFTAITESPEQYLKWAEDASVVAHQHGRDCVAYTPKIAVYAKENLSMLGELKNGIDSGQMTLHYQPKVSI